MRQERLRHALAGAFALVLLSLAAGYEVHEHADKASVWADIAFFGYPALVAFVTAGLNIWVSGERSIGRIGRALGWGVLAGTCVLLVLFYVALSSIEFP